MQSDETDSSRRKFEANAGGQLFFPARQKIDQGQFHQSIYVQLLHAKISEVQKRQSSCLCLFVLLGPASVKVALRIW